MFIGFPLSSLVLPSQSFILNLEVSIGSLLLLQSLVLVLQSYQLHLRHVFFRYRNRNVVISSYCFWWFLIYSLNLISLDHCRLLPFLLKIGLNIRWVSYWHIHCAYIGPLTHQVLSYFLFHVSSQFKSKLCIFVRTFIQISLY